MIMLFPYSFYRVRKGQGKPGESWNLRISFSWPGKSWKIKDLFGRSVTAYDKTLTM